MGYTNYFYVKKGQHKFPDRFLKDVECAIKRYNEKYPDSTVWFTQHSDTCVTIDGPGVTCENLVVTLLPEDWQPKEDEFIFGCCKTRMDTYDIIVKAVIMLGVKNGVIESYSADGYVGEEELAKADEEIVKGIE